MIGKVLQASKNVTLVEVAFKGTLKARETMRPAGVDSLPLQNDIAVVSNDESSCEHGIIIKPKVSPGEIRLRARTGTGSEISSVYLKSDGSVEISASGPVEINGATVTEQGDVVTAQGVSLNNHVHAYASPSGPAVTGAAQ